MYWIELPDKPMWSIKKMPFTEECQKDKLVAITLIKMNHHENFINILISVSNMHVITSSNCDYQVYISGEDISAENILRWIIPY